MSRVVDYIFYWAINLLLSKMERRMMRRTKEILQSNGVDVSAFSDKEVYEGFRSCSPSLDPQEIIDVIRKQKETSSEWPDVIGV